MHPRYWAMEDPNKTAIINATTGVSITYGELDKRCNRVANMVCSLGLTRGDHIAIFMENNERFFEIVWAALSSGLYVTPINRFLMADEAAYIINDCGAKAVFTSADLYDQAELIPDLCDNIIPFYITDSGNQQQSPVNPSIFQIYEEEIERLSEEPLKESTLGSFMLYSSGTTGKPKGIKHPLKDINYDALNTALSAQATALIPYNKETIFLCPTPLYHSAACHLSTAMVSLGATLVFMPKFDPSKALEAIETYQVTDSWWVPTLFIRMLKLSQELREQYDLSTLKTAIHAAAPCPVEAKKKMMEWWGPIIYEFYGGTENNGLVLATPTEWLDNPGTVGKAIYGQIHICSEEGKELPAGEKGIVYFEQPIANFSYHNDTDKTKKSQHPLHSNWTTLGDIGFVNDRGYLFLTDRKNFVIISGGVNIYPQEIEDIMIMHDSVEDVAVFGVPNNEMGEEVKAVVQTTPNKSRTTTLEAELIEFARSKLAHYKCPKSIDFIERMPRLPTGKLYKEQLKMNYWKSNNKTA